MEELNYTKEELITDDEKCRKAERAKEEIETTPAHISEAKRILLEKYFENVTKEQFIKSIS